MLELQYAVDELKFDDAYLNFLQNTTRTKKFVNVKSHRYLEDARASYTHNPSHPVFVIWPMWDY